MNESEKTEEIETFPFYPYLLQELQTLANCKPISVGRPSDIRYTTPLPHPTTSRHDTFASPNHLKDPEQNAECLESLQNVSNLAISDR